MKHLFKLLPILSFCCEEDPIIPVDLNKQSNKNNNNNSPTNPNPTNQRSSLPKCFNEPMKLEDILTPLQLAGQIEYECFRWINELSKKHNMDINDLDFDNFGSGQDDKLWEKLEKSSLKDCKAPDKLRKLYDLGKSKFGYSEKTGIFGPQDKSNPLFSNNDIDFNDREAVKNEVNKFMERATNPQIIKSLSDEDLNIIEKGLLQSRLIFLGSFLLEEENSSKPHDKSPMILLPQFFRDLGTQNIRTVRDNLLAGRYT